MDIQQKVLKVGYLIVDHDESPELLQDLYWDMTIPQDIPYTLAAEKYKGGEFVGSAEATLQVKESEKVYATVKTDNVPKIQLNGVDLSDGATMVSGIYEVGSNTVNFTLAPCIFDFCRRSVLR